MLKSILNLSGAQQLSRNEQKSIAGGDYHLRCDSHDVCEPYGAQCICGVCKPMGEHLDPGC